MIRRTHLVIWAWSAKPTSAAILDKQSDPLVMRSQACRARNSARSTDGVTPYAVVKPLDTVSRANPFASAHSPISVDASLPK